MTTQSDPLKATVWMIGAMVSFSLMAVSGRELAISLNTFEILLYRSIIGLLIVLVIGFFAKTLTDIKSDRLDLHLFSNLAHFVAKIVDSIAKRRPKLWKIRFSKHVRRRGPIGTGPILTTSVGFGPNPFPACRSKSKANPLTRLATRCEMPRILLTLYFVAFT